MCMSTLWSCDQDDSLSVFVTDDPPEHKLKSGPAFTGDSTLLLFLTTITPLQENSQLTHTVGVLCQVPLWAGASGIEHVNTLRLLAAD